MSEIIYLQQSKNHNKFWSYEVDGNDVICRNGRLGGNITKRAPKKFSSSYSRDDFIEKKVREKLRKGYEKKDDDFYQQEVNTAQSLGTQYKISRMLFVSKKGDKIEQISDYDPKQWVYVEVLNSWSKSIVRLLLSKNQSIVISGGVVESGRTISFGNQESPSGKEIDFVATVREVLKKLSNQIIEVIKTVKFAAMGARSLFDDEDDDEIDSQEQVNFYKSFETGSVDSSVIRKFAAIGARELDL